MCKAAFDKITPKTKWKNTSFCKMPSLIQPPLRIGEDRVHVTTILVARNSRGRKPGLTQHPAFVRSFGICYFWCIKFKAAYIYISILYTRQKVYLTRQWKVLADKCTPVGRTVDEPKNVSCYIYNILWLQSFHNFNRCNTVHRGALFPRSGSLRWRVPWLLSSVPPPAV